MSDLPIYKFGIPFDNIKIIFNSLVGDPRYHFRPDGIKYLYAHSEFDKDVFKVDTDPYMENVNQIYAEQAISKDSFNSIEEFGPLFYEFGLNSLTQIAASILKTNALGRSILCNNFRVANDKLGIVFGKFFKEFLKITGIKVDKDGFYLYKNEEIAHLEFEKLIEDLDFYYDSSIINESSYNEFGNILSATYLALTLYLNGVIINMGNKLGIELATIYSEENDVAIDQFGNNLIGSSSIEEDSKFKLISLIYTHYLMTQFYEDKTGFNFKDPYIKIFYNIGEKISKMGIDSLGEEMDITHLTQSDLIRNSKITMLSVLTPVSVMKDSAIFDTGLFEHEIADMSTVALQIVNYLVYDEQDKLKLLHSPLCTYMMEDVSETDVDVLYNHFLDLVNTLPHTISPKFFYQIIVYAAAFRFLKAKKSGSVKEEAALGMYQAEAILTFLYRHWFDTRYFYQIGGGFYSKDVRRNANEIKANLYIKSSIYEYLIFAHQLENNDFKLDYNIKYFIGVFNRAIVVINSDNEDLTQAKNEVANLRFNTYGTDNFDNNFKYINDSNYENYDDNVKLLNKGRSLLEFYLTAKDNSPAYGPKYLNEVLETEFQTQSIDKLANYALEDSKYSTIYDCKLARALSANLDKVLTDENSDDKFISYFNVFIKYTIPIYLTHLVFDKTTKNESDNLGNTIKEDEKVLPNLQSQRLFNFLNRS